MSEEELAIYLEETRSENYFRSLINSDIILLAAKDNRIAGYIQLCDIKSTIKTATNRDQAINALYIHSDFQGQGIGKTLMDMAFAHKRFKDAENIYVDVWDENERAVALYKKYGFKIVGQCEVTAGGKRLGYDLVMMRPAILS